MENEHERRMEENILSHFLRYSKRKLYRNYKVLTEITFFFPLVIVHIS
jgi:hypothetical protein